VTRRNSSQSQEDSRGVRNGFFEDLPSVSQLSTNLLHEGLKLLISQSSAITPPPQFGKILDALIDSH